ncbi:MAG: sigma 54-interacting transcriptional regulator [Myxococcales bacterium]
MIEILASEEPLAHRLVQERTRDGVGPQLTCAVLAALAGDARESEAALRRALAGSGAEHEFLVDVARAFLLVETGAAGRAGAPLLRARGPLHRRADPSATSVLLLLQAQAMFAKRGPSAARALAADAQGSIPAGEQYTDLRTYAALVHAAIALEAGDLAGAERELSNAAPARSGILAARADVLRARLHFRHTGDARAAAIDLDRAIHRLTVTGAARDLGLACLERALQAARDPNGLPAYWLARAKSHLATSGSRRDLEALRRACDALERRAPAGAEPAGEGSPFAPLSVATSALACLEDRDELIAAIPRLALVACGGAGAQLVRTAAEGPAEVLAASGAEISLHGDALADQIRRALSNRGSTSDAQLVSVLRVGAAEERLALVVERAPADGEAGLEQLAIYAAFAGVSLARASSRPIVREAGGSEGGAVIPIAKRAVGSTTRFTFESLIGDDPAFREVLDSARRAATSDLPILISGESGTGKELLAQAIHDASGREAAPFVAVNVTAIPRELVESELFGYESGTFTGARASGMAGKFELAGRGTLLLDEIGDMPLEIQAKLLRVLQERAVHRLGSAADVPVRARVIAATHRDLAEAVQTGQFRLDLYHRLRVVHLRLPPLRERRGDILRIAERQLALYAERMRRPAIRLSSAVAAAFEEYDWPGNVRELCNVVETEASLLTAGENLISRIPQALRDAPARSSAGPVVPLEEMERRACRDALEYFCGNVSRAARALGVSKTTLYTKMKKYRIGPVGAMMAAAS